MYAALAGVLSFGAGTLYIATLHAAGVDDAVGAFSRPLDDVELGSERGAAQHVTKVGTQVFNSMVVSGEMSNITVTDNITGNNIIDGGSFAGSQGFPMVIQNSGNGVLIQNATILNVTIEQ
jgi:hypothetical protein